MHTIAWWPTLIVVAVATATDLRSRRIPNWLVFPFFAAGLAVAVGLHGWPGLAQSLEGTLLGLFLYGLLFWVGAMGAGDVKLCAAIGAWIGPHQLFLALVFTGLAGGLMAVGWAVCGGFFEELLQGTGALLCGSRPAMEPSSSPPPPHSGAGANQWFTRKMPYAPAIALGTLLSFFAR